MSNSHPFVYFVPGPHEAHHAADNGQVNQDFLRGAGLGGVLRDLEKHPRDLVVNALRRGGPGESGGVLLIPTVGGVCPQRVNYSAEAQQWRPAEAAPTAEGAEGAEKKAKFWIGWEKENPPQPEDLERRKTVPGLFVPDASGRHWLIPVARMPSSDTGMLPTNYGRRGGRVTRSVKHEHAELWRIACQVEDSFQLLIAVRDALQIDDEAERNAELKKLENHPGGFDDDWLAERAVDVLAVNYRLGWEEVNAFAAMGAALLDEETRGMIAHALVNTAAWLAFKKKETPANGPAKPGSASCASSAPAAAPATE